MKRTRISKAEADALWQAAGQMTDDFWEWSYDTAPFPRNDKYENRDDPKRVKYADKRDKAFNDGMAKLRAIINR